MLPDMETKTLPTQREMAKVLGIKEAYLNAILNDRQRCSARLAVEIDRLFGIPKEKLRPDIFGEERE